MTRQPASLVLLAIAAAALLTGAAAPATHAATSVAACVQPSQPEALAILHAAEVYMTARYPAIYGGARVQSIAGDWALVVVTPSVAADRAALILHRLPGGSWAVVAGPGTAFPPDSRPAGMPAELLDPTAACGNA